MKVGTDALLLGASVSVKGISQVLDIGTGTGILSLMLAQRSMARIDAVEIDANAAKQAGENFANSSWSYRLRVFNVPVQEFQPETGHRYDLIISNPPFFEGNEKAAKESAKYRERELARSISGLTPQELFTNAARLLKPSGRFSAIFPYSSFGAMISVAESQGLFINEIIEISSRSGQAPVRVILSFSFQASLPKKETLMIYEANGTYTDAYIQLTRPFYAIDMQNRKNQRNNETRKPKETNSALA